MDDLKNQSFLTKLICAGNLQDADNYVNACAFKEPQAALTPGRNGAENLLPETELLCFAK